MSDDGYPNNNRVYNPHNPHNPHNPYPKRRKRVIPAGHFIPPKGSIYCKYKLQMCRKFEENKF